MRITPTIVLLFALSSFASGQHVMSKSYDKMLGNLLAHSVPEISVSEAALLKNVVFLDAREPKEFNVSHIQQAHWCGYTDFDLNRLNGVPKEVQLIVYCSVGYRSEKIAEKLLAAGYKNTRNLYGGIFEWKNEGHPVVDAAGHETQKVHAFDKTWGKWLEIGIKVYN